MRLRVSRLLLLILFLLFIIHVEVEAQTATVTATVTDTAAQAFSNGTYKIEFRPTPGKDISQFTNNGAAFTKLYSGVLDGSGTFTQAGVTRNDFIQPGLSQWIFTICPNASSACVSANIFITSASPNLSSTLSNLTTIQTFAMPIPYTYTDGEVKATPNPGQIYYNSLNKSHRYWDGITWNSFSGTKAITTCTGLIGDGVSSDVVAINACINTNQGRHILLPKTQAIGSCDYNINGGTITPKGLGQIIEGEGAGWGTSTNVTLCKTVEDGLPGVDLIHANCQNCTLKNISITGPAPWSSVTLTQNIPPCTPPNGQSYAGGIVCVTAGDGIKVEGAFTTLENIYVNNWGRFGVYTTSDFGGFPDNFNYINVTSNDNRADGFYFKGGDANAGSSLQLHAYNNMMYGLNDQGFLGNSHYSPQLTGNHVAGTTLGATSAITAISRTTNVVTLTSAGHNASTGNVIVVAGVTDGTFNGTFSVSSTTSTTITYAQIAGNASSSSGTVRLTSNNEFYAATGIIGGSYNMQQAAAWNTLYSPYCEGSQNPITGASKLVIIGGDQGCGIDYTNNPFVIGFAIVSSPIQNANLATGAGGFSFLTPVDTGALLMNWAAGKTLDTSIEHRFMGANTLTTYWDWVHNVGGTQGGNTASLALFRGSNGSHKRLAFGGPGVAGVTELLDEGTATRINNGTGSSGNVEFYSAGGGQLIHDFLTSGQYFMTPSANNIDVIKIKRFTNSSPTGNYLNFLDASNNPLYQVDITGKQLVDNGLTTASVGHPIIVASVDSIGNTALIASTNLLASAPVGLYRIEAYMASTTTCGTPGPGQVIFRIDWTGENGAVFNTQIAVLLGVLTISTTTGNNISPFYVNSISNITYQTTYTACTSGTGTYNLRLRLIRE